MSPQGYEGPSHHGHWGDFVKADRKKKSATLEGGEALWMKSSDSPSRRKSLMTTSPRSSGSQASSTTLGRPIPSSTSGSIRTRWWSTLMKTSSWVPIQSQRHNLLLVYSLPSYSLRSFEDVKQAFYHQYASWWELKKNSNHLFLIKMKPGESLKHFVIYFKSQMILVYNCNDYVVVAAFISEL